MKATQLLSFAASAALALTLFACSDDKDDEIPDIGKCEINAKIMGVSVDICKDNTPKEECTADAINEEYDLSIIGVTLKDNQVSLSSGNCKSGGKTCEGNPDVKVYGNNNQLTDGVCGFFTPGL